MADKDDQHPICTRKLKLSDGNEIPIIGLGTLEAGMYFEDDQNERIIESTINALRAGYRLLDTSKVYATENLVGEAIRRSGVPREEITVVTKLWQSDHQDPKAGFEEAFKKLNIGYIDIFLMHWPCATDAEGNGLAPDQSPTYVETWKMMEELVGPKLRSIGVSNFTQKTLEVLLKEAKIKPVVNQIEAHVQNPNLKLIPWCQERGIQVMAWGPLAGGPHSHYTDVGNVYSYQPLASIAAQHHCSIGAVLLSWLVQRDVVVIPHSSSPTRLSENTRPVRLTGTEMQVISDVHKALGQVRLIDYATFVWKDTRIMGWTVQEVGWEDDKGNWLI